MGNVAISVIVSTYNAEAWLEKVLVGYSMQTFKDFELVIADDGSGPKTRELIENFRDRMPFPIVHEWHEDNGFQKTVILNKAIRVCRAPYIVMSDGDCIPRPDFLEVHNARKEKGYFLSGGYFMLPLDISQLIAQGDIISGKCFDLRWLKANGLKASFKNNKLTAKGLKAALLNFITPTNASWNGHNASGWKQDIMAVSGFDERMQYGGEDREMGERLFHNGIKSKQIRYSAVCLHLEHERGYKNEEAIAKNRVIWEHTKASKSKWTPFGIVKGEAMG